MGDCIRDLGTWGNRSMHHAIGFPGSLGSTQFPKDINLLTKNIALEVITNCVNYSLRGGNFLPNSEIFLVFL